MPFAPNAEAAIWYDDDGASDAGEARETVLLVHGGLFDPMDGARFWRAPGVVSDLVAAGYRVLTPDRRFHGRTTTPFAAHSWAREASDLLAVVRQGGLARVHVVAGSNGCSAALRLALLAPETVASLALCWPAAPRRATRPLTRPSRRRLGRSSGRGRMPTSPRCATWASHVEERLRAGPAFPGAWPCRATTR